MDSVNISSDLIRSRSDASAFSRKDTRSSKPISIPDSVFDSVDPISLGIFAKGKSESLLEAQIGGAA